MPPGLNEPEEHPQAGIAGEDPWPGPPGLDGTDGLESGEDDQTLLGHDQLLALRSSRHVTRRPRRRRRWPWITGLVVLAVAAAFYGVYAFGWTYVEDFLITRNVSSAAAGYPGLITTYSDGVATIAGEVETTADADLLVASIGRVDGVEEVRADLTVAAASTSGALETAILEGLAGAGITTVTPIIEGSTVTLIGTVTEPNDLDIASSIAVGIDGVSQVLNRVVVASDVSSAARQLLDAAGFATVAVLINGNLAVLSGTVAADRDVLAAADVVLGLPGVEKVDNRLEVGTTPDTTAVPVGVPGDESSALAAALEDAGYEGIAVTLDGSVAYLDGVVPFDVLEDGYFAFVDDVRSIVLEVGDEVTVVNRLRLRGDEQELRDQLQALLEESPIVFLSGSSDLTIESQAALDIAAKIILSQPGLQIFIAGHTDASGSAEANQQLAGERGRAVYGYLVSVGVPANRMAVVSYGELFPGRGASAADDRRIEFEVGP
ncbi:MAG: BON domain-containing protein [Acidimicrobiia bacterium]|nr:BON domain-containing protein [Acidimicrobiia bacterium]